MFIHITLETAPNEMQLMRPTATWLQQADHMPIIFRSYFGLQQADHMPNYSDLISGYSKPIICRTIPILFQVTAGRS